MLSGGGTPGLRLRRWVGLGVVVVALTGGPGGQASQVPDPRTEPIPPLDLSQGVRALAVHLRFDSRTAVSVLSVTVVDGQAHGRAADPPLLRLDLVDGLGHLISRANAWHPMVVEAEEADGTREVPSITTADGRFILPFSPVLSAMRVRDLILKRNVATIDLSPAVAGYCQNQPADPACVVHEHPRDLSLRLARKGGAIVARGRIVGDGFQPCGAEARVEVQARIRSKWKVVGRDTTDGAGAFRDRIRDRANRYRAVAAWSAVGVNGNEICLSAASRSRRA